MCMHILHSWRRIENCPCDAIRIVQVECNLCIKKCPFLVLELSDIIDTIITVLMHIKILQKLLGRLGQRTWSL